MGVVDGLEVVDVEDHQVVVLLQQRLIEDVTARQPGQVVGLGQGCADG